MNELQIVGSCGPSHLPCCGVTAVAVVAGVPFSEAWCLMRAGRGQAWKGRTNRNQRMEALKALGVSWREPWGIPLMAERRHRLKWWIRNRLNARKVYMVTVTGHAIAVRYLAGAWRYADQHVGGEWQILASNPRLLNKLVNEIIEVEA